DEVNCSNRYYCHQGASISIHNSRVCNGIIDCNDASDEAVSKCNLSRYYCKNGKPLSVPMFQVEDGVRDCTDGSDECPPNSKKSSVFSSQYEMIANTFIRAVFWIMSFLSIFGNSLVIYSAIKDFIYQKNAACTEKCQNWMVVNLAISDILMGLFLLIICIKGVHFSGSYCYHDIAWRSSTTCSSLGALATLSTEASIMMMTVMTIYRILAVYRPFLVRSMRVKWLVPPVLFVWLIAVLVAAIPLVKLPSGYFVTSVWYPNRFYRSEENVKEKHDVVGEPSHKPHRHSVGRRQLYTIRREIGYYGGTSVCMPRLYLKVGDATWGYSTFIVTFNFILFMFIFVSYILIYKKGTKMKPQKDKSRKLQNKITRLIITDFCCWIPICLLAYISLGGVALNKIVYAVSAGLIFPINSALNPLLYSSVIETNVLKLWRLISRASKKTSSV
uniref:G-protein coupled receptors family 1 profile domain-containing protein n=1 Tax=Ciona intestinalis TaxID=7719 RepID=F6YU08_CIOIN